MAGFSNYFVVALIVIVVTVFFNVLRKRAQKELFAENRMNFIVCAPNAYKVIGFICTGIFAFAFIGSTMAMWGDPDYPWVAGIFAGFLALGLFIVYYSFRWKLVVAEYTLILTPLFGLDRMYSVREITHIKMDVNLGIKVYAGKKKLFNVDRFSTGGTMLISYFIENGVRAPDKIII